MHPSQLLTSVPLILLAPFLASAMLRCENIRVDGHSFDLSKLGGPHSVVTTRYLSAPDAHHNTTYTLDICRPLKKSGKGETDTIEDVVAIAGSLENVGGSQFDYSASRLKTSDSNTDSQKEGLRLVLKGGKHPLDGPVKERREQKAVIEFLCDHKKKGDEGEWDAEDKYEEGSTARLPRSVDTNDEDKSKEDEKDGGDEKDGDEKDGKEKDGDKKDGDEAGGDDPEKSSVEHQLKKEDAALIWESFEKEKDADVLRLTWHTKYACEKREESDDDNGNSSRHWGFFTWFVIIVFLTIAAYLIFGSWLNYNRYGARGWDLLPHGDALRDVPYMFKDWLRRVLNTVQGTGSRGGYSAV